MARIPLKFQPYSGDIGEIPDAATDSLGGFCLKISLSNNLGGRVFWSINAPDYSPKVGEVLASEETAPLTIRLQRIGTILIEAHGRVVDSATSQPIPGPMIVLATNYNYAKPDTSYTGDDGRFRRMVQGGVTSSSRSSFAKCRPRAKTSDPFPREWRNRRRNRLIKERLGGKW